MSIPPERRRRLQELGLRALVKRRFGADVAVSARLAADQGAVMVLADRPDGRHFAAVFADSPAGLAAAVDATSREGADHLYFFAELNTAGVARRAAQFRIPVSVVSPDGDFETLRPAPAPTPSPMPPLLGSIERRLLAAGLDPVWEHDVLTGEWNGLEVARATVTTPGPTPPDLTPPGLTPPGLSPFGDRVEFDVGVGKHDREGNRLLYPDGAPDELLAHAVATVADLRRPGAGPHPANQLVPDRWLRSVLVSRPTLVGVASLTIAPPPERRDDLRQRGVAPAWGLDAEGRPVVFVCSVGVDPDLVPQAADALVQAPGWPAAPPTGWRLVIVVPDGDDHPLTRRAAALLRSPAEVITVPAGWRSMGA